MSNDRQLLMELMSSVSDIARRIGPACNHQWVRQELERIVSETKYKPPMKWSKPSPPSKESNQPAAAPVKTSGWIRGEKYVETHEPEVPFDL